MDYLHVKALHIIFVVSWFAGLFYLPRLFVYHTEAQQQPEAERRVLSEQFARMEKLLLNAIMTPALWLTLLTGTTLLYLTPAWLSQGWMHLKLAFVLGLVAYHFFSRKLLLEMRRGHFRFSSLQLRLWNEVATVLLFSIVFLVVLKNTLDWLWGVLGLLAFAVLIMSAVRLAKKVREKKPA
jgi:protoporphyrinogen IX oxidase